jgi:hypothetical protein
MPRLFSVDSVVKDRRGPNRKRSLYALGMEEPSHGYDRALLYLDRNHEFPGVGWGRTVADAVKRNQWPALFFSRRVKLLFEGKQVGHKRFRSRTGRSSMRSESAL